VVERIWREFGDELHLFFRNFPLSHIPPHAQAAAETAEASGSQGRFWEMHGVLFNNQGHLEDEDLGHCTPQLCLDSKRFGRELAAHARVRRVREDLEGGLESGVQVMPTFYVNGVHHDGSPNLETLRAAIEAARSFAATPEQARRAGVMPNTG
jgi:protein-disulfide isomerase